MTLKLPHNPHDRPSLPHNNHHHHHHGGGGRQQQQQSSTAAGAGVPEISQRTNRTEGGTELSTQSFELGEDVYSLIFISPYCSGPFIFAILMICLKMALFTFLAIDLSETARENGIFTGERTLIRATQFCLMPVAVAIQEDLIYVYTRVANIRYDKTLKDDEETMHATEFKFALSFLLRFLDGIYSLTINFTLLLITTEVLGIFLNFAALQFLQSIDDIAFQLAANGYLGDEMEDLCEVVTRTTLPKRVGDAFTNSLDSVLYFTTYAVMLAVWTLSVVQSNNSDE